MNKKLTLIIAIETLLIIALFWVLIFYGKDEYEVYQADQHEEIESPSHVTTKAGLNVVALSPATQQNSGIQTALLQSSQHASNIEYLGSVVSIDGLAELRARYWAAKAESQVIQASSANNSSEYQRLKTLNADDKNVSDSALATAESALKSNQTRLQVSETAANSIVSTMRQQWGDALTKMATQKAANKPLLDKNVALVQILFPLDAEEPTASARLMISVADSPNNKGASASFLSPSANTDATRQGKTYYYLVTDNTMRVGTRVKASPIKSTNALADGVVIPNSAVVWYAGKPWAYFKQGRNQAGQNQFVRKPISAEVEVDGGWFNRGLSADSEIVLNGAQLLLSEEFKYEIKNENED